MTKEAAVIILDSQSPDGYTQLRVNDKIALQSMPMRPFRVTHIFAGGDDARVGGVFPKGGVIMVNARQLASAFLVKRTRPEFDFGDKMPPIGCVYDVFEKQYDKLGGKKDLRAQSYEHFEQGHDLQSVIYARQLANAGMTYPFPVVPSDQGARVAPANDDTQVDDEQAAADADAYEAWLAQQSA